MEKYLTEIFIGLTVLLLSGIVTALAGVRKMAIQNQANCVTLFKECAKLDHLITELTDGMHSLGRQTTQHETQIKDIKKNHHEDHVTLKEHEDAIRSIKSIESKLDMVIELFKASKEK